MKPLRGAKVVFYHKSYSYFVARFGLDVVDFVEIKPGIQPGPGHLADLVGTIRSRGVKVVATHPFYDEKVAKLVADKGGARLVMLPLQVGGVKGADDYLKLFDVATGALIRAVND
jgi:ABC-type Zn uptake system ZnuABC Zn-binding protein ZnuA